MSERLGYEAPTLVDIGAVRDLTLGQLSGVLDQLFGAPGGIINISLCVEIDPITGLCLDVEA